MQIHLSHQIFIPWYPLIQWSNEGSWVVVLITMTMISYVQILGLLVIATSLNSNLTSLLGGISVGVASIFLRLLQKVLWQLQFGKLISQQSHLNKTNYENTKVEILEHKLEFDTTFPSHSYSNQSFWGTKNWLYCFMVDQWIIGLS